MRTPFKTLFSVALFTATAAMAVPANAEAPSESYFEVAREDVATAVSSTLAERGAADKVRAIVYSADPVLYRANAPLKVAIQALTFEPSSHKWQANMHILSRDKTVSIRPIQGRYEAIISVPVLTHKASASDIITDADITMIDVSERLVRKDTVIDPDHMLGKSPKRHISPNRPIRLTELNLPVIVKKGATVEIQYTTPHMNIRTSGRALEDGSLGSLVRVQNTQSERAISARVINTGVVETTPKQQQTAIN